MLHHSKYCVFTSRSLQVENSKYPLDTSRPTTKQYLTPNLTSQKRVANFPAIEPVGRQSTVSLIIFRMIAWTRPIHQQHQQASSRRRQARHAAYCKMFARCSNCGETALIPILKTGRSRRGCRVAITIRILPAVIAFRITRTGNQSRQCDVRPPSKNQVP